MQSLKARKADALASQRYEEAAVLRDQLLQLQATSPAAATACTQESLGVAGLASKDATEWAGASRGVATPLMLTIDDRQSTTID